MMMLSNGNFCVTFDEDKENCYQSHDEDGTKKHCLTHDTPNTTTGVYTLIYRTIVMAGVL